MQLQMQNQETVTRAVDAKAKSDEALAAERINKVGLDAALSAERISRAEEDQTAGALNLIKAIKELEGLDISNLMQKIQILKEIQGKRRAVKACGVTDCPKLRTCEQIAQ